MYRTMLLARRLDDRMWALNRQGRVPFVVSVSGHEATQVGAAFALDPSSDWSLPYYRDIAFNLAMGVTPEDIFLGVFSKAADPASGGRQMPNHWSRTQPQHLHPLVGDRHPVPPRLRHRLRAEGGRAGPASSLSCPAKAPPRRATGTRR